MTVSIDDIKKARLALDGKILHTPMFGDDKLSREIGAHIFLKAESLQKSGSFKIRGAIYKMSRLSEEEKARGVVTASAGNHAQGVALAATLNGIKSTIVLPEIAPLTKINATKAFGGNVIMHGEAFDDAIAHARELEKEHGYTFVHGFDDEDIVSGQGTIGLEIFESLPDIDVVVVPIGGGGLISGIAIALKALKPDIRVVGVQAENIAPVKESLRVGHPIIHPGGKTIADGIAIKRPGTLNLEIIRDFVDEIVEVSEEEIARGIFSCMQNNRLVVEGAGAAGLAALLAGKVPVMPSEKVCAVLCGGNIDANLLARVLEQVLVRNGRYVMLKLLVPDLPGNLANILNLVAAARANVVDVFHRRAMWLAPLGRVGIELLLEVRDAEHADDVKTHLRSNGYEVEHEAAEWRENRS